MSIDKLSMVSAGLAGSAGEALLAPAKHAASAARRAPAADFEASSRRIEEIARRLQSYVNSVSRSLEFRIDPASGHTVISVHDSTTGELIRQIPNEEVLRFAEAVDDQTIVLLSEKA